MYVLTSGFTIVSSFHTFQVVDPVTETLLEVGGNLNIERLRRPGSSVNTITLSSLNLPLSFSSTTSRELLSQFSACSG